MIFAFSSAKFYIENIYNDFFKCQGLQLKKALSAFLKNNQKDLHHLIQQNMRQKMYQLTTY